MQHPAPNGIDFSNDDDTLEPLYFQKYNGSRAMDSLHPATSAREIK
jgi:hypothetical protein